MAIYLEMPHLNEEFPFKTFLNDGDILTTPHWHKELEIIYVKEGVIHMGIGETAMDVQTGEFAVVAGGRVHYVLASPGSIRWVYQFDENFFHGLMQEQSGLDSIRELWKDYPSHSREWRSELADAARSLLDHIFEEDQSKKYAYTFAVKGYLCLLMRDMYRNREFHQGEKAYEYRTETSRTLEKLDVIFRYVEAHYMEPVTLQAVSKHVGFSPFYFTKFFKRHVGKTFVQFLNEYRIEKAKWILLNEDISAMELIERIGIGSTKTYYRLFQEIVGVAPGQYLRQRRQEQGNIL